MLNESAISNKSAVENILNLYVIIALHFDSVQWVEGMETTNVSMKL